MTLDEKFRLVKFRREVRPARRAPRAPFGHLVALAIVIYTAELVLLVLAIAGYLWIVE